MDKKTLSERDICTKFITPALEASGWDRNSQFLEEVNLTSGRVVVRGNKAKRDEKTIVDCVAELRALCANLRQRLISFQQTQSRLAEALVESVVA